MIPYSIVNNIVGEINQFGVNNEQNLQQIYNLLNAAVNANSQLNSKTFSGK